tara:strand:- start:173 stop:367 length:195 start_codon:yes stop_codon:yes gene_type:complete
MEEIELEEALVILYKGQSNIAIMARRVGLPLPHLQKLFREYVARTPIDPELWKGDVEISWPFVT